MPHARLVCQLYTRMKSGQRIAIARRSRAAVAHACHAMCVGCGWLRRLADAPRSTRLPKARPAGLCQTKRPMRRRRLSSITRAPCCKGMGTPGQRSQAARKVASASMLSRQCHFFRRHSLDPGLQAPALVCSRDYLLSMNFATERPRSPRQRLGENDVTWESYLDTAAEYVRLAGRVTNPALKLRLISATILADVRFSDHAAQGVMFFDR